MKKQLLVILSVAVASFLIGTMFSTNYLASGKPPSVWDAINELQAKVNSLTNTVTEQQTQISELQTQVDILNATKLGTPDYDSGWTPIAQGELTTFVHGLGTTEVIVYAIGRQVGYNNQYDIHQRDYGGNLDAGVYWNWLTENSIEVVRKSNDGTWSEVRVMLWKIAEP